MTHYSDPRKRYWNEDYLKYWQARTIELASAANSDGRIADPSVFSKYMASLDIRVDHIVLEVGVGFGRLLGPISSLSAHVYGVDISPEMIAEARRLTAKNTSVIQLLEAEAERLPYAESFFDRVICWGVFDACYQEVALSEMRRVLKPDGRLLITGKNDDYWDDDEAAYEAEVNARAKGHPNYFIDVSKLRASLPSYGLREERLFRFERRGDMASDKTIVSSGTRFYEFALVLQKSTAAPDTDPPVFSNRFSKTFQRRVSMPPSQSDVRKEIEKAE